MIDSICSYLETQERISRNYLKVDFDGTDNLTGEKRLYAKLGNLKLKQINNNLNVSGSLTKYYHNNNLINLTRKETEIAIEKISDELKVNYKNSRLFSVDIAFNLIMNQDVKKYFHCLGDMKYLIKGNINDTIYFENSRKKITFYNKYMEMINNKIIIPEEYRQFRNNILRYELRFKKRLKSEFKKSLYISDLYDDDFLRKSIEKWKYNYFAIYKINKLNIINMEKLTFTELHKLIFSKLIIENGLDSVLQEIDSLRSNCKTSTEASRCKKYIKNLLNNKKFSETNELIRELDEKIIKKVEEYR